MRPRYKQLEMFVAAIALLGAMTVMPLFVSGCKSTVLSKDGAYQNDPLLYQADQAAKAAYTTLNAFLTWEQDNQTYLAQYPQVHTFAEKVRDQAKPAFQAAALARSNYQAARTTANAQAMNATAAVLNALVDTATQILAERKTTP